MFTVSLYTLTLSSVHLKEHYDILAIMTLSDGCLSSACLRASLVHNPLEHKVEESRLEVIS